MFRTTLLFLCMITSIGYASDKTACDGAITLGKYSAKKYVINNYDYDNASSKVCFALFGKNDDKNNTVVVYNRKESYKKCAERTAPLTERRTTALTILNDTHLVTGRVYKNGLHVIPIFWEEKAKNIQLPKYESPSDIDTNSIEGLQAMKHNSTQFLCTTSCAGVFVLDVETGTVVNNFDIKGSVISPALPNKSGDGIWYIASESRVKAVEPNSKSIDFFPTQYTLGHYDLRSAKTTIKIDMPENIHSRSFSINPSGTHCAFTSKHDRVHIFDVTAQKMDQTIVMPKEDRVDHTMFVNDTTLMYETKKQKPGELFNADHQLHTHPLSSSGDRECCALPHSTRFHQNTGLVIGYDWPSKLVIYDFDFKQ